MHELTKIITAARDLIAANQRGVVVTVVRTQGSTYRRAGARALIAEDGRAVGAISGGCLERDLAQRVRAWLDDLSPRVVSYDSTRADDVVFGLGLGCRGKLELLVEPFDAAHPPRLVRDFAWNGGEAVEWTTTLPDGEVLVEVIRPERAVVLFGGSADAEPVEQLARAVGWRVDVVTARTCHPNDVASKLDLTPYDAAIVMTHNFLFDVELLRALLATRIPYIGILGPKKRGDELLAELGAAREPRIHSPIGLDLGGETPEEIALSIVAEVQAVLNRRDAKPLRELTRPIHDDANAAAWA